jgi:hypothetical protein
MIDSRKVWSQDVPEHRLETAGPVSEDLLIGFSVMVDLFSLFWHFSQLGTARSSARGADVFSLFILSIFVNTFQQFNTNPSNRLQH